MDTIIDLLGALVIAGFIILGISNLNVYSTDMRFKSNSELSLISNAKTLSDILENDLRKIGFNNSSNSMLIANEQKIKFIADIDSNGVVDTVSYSLSDSLAVLYTENPSDKILYRTVNGDTSKGPSLGITDLKFIYKKINGSITTVLDSIKYITAEMWIESPELVGTDTNKKFLFTYWELSINPRNI